jgi:hypothetical protein
VETEVGARPVQGDDSTGRWKGHKSGAPISATEENVCGKGIVQLDPIHDITAGRYRGDSRLGLGVEFPGS